MNFILMTSFPQIIIFSSLAPVQAEFYLNTLKRIRFQRQALPYQRFWLSFFALPSVRLQTERRKENILWDIHIPCEDTTVHNVLLGFLKILMEAYNTSSFPPIF